MRSMICRVILLLPILAALPTLPTQASYEAAQAFAAEMGKALGMEMAPCTPERDVPEAFSPEDAICGKAPMPLRKFLKAWKEEAVRLSAAGPQVQVATGWQTMRDEPGQLAEFYVGGTPLRVEYRTKTRDVTISYKNYNRNRWPCDAAAFESDRSLYFEGQTPDLVPASFSSGEQPGYPELARVARQEGVVVVAHVVEVDGSTSNLCFAQPYHSDVGFEEAALEAIADWTFEPATLNGQPVRSLKTSVATFRLTRP